MSCIVPSYKIINQVVTELQEIHTSNNIDLINIVPYTIVKEATDHVNIIPFSCQVLGTKIVELAKQAFLNCYNGRHAESVEGYVENYKFEVTDKISYINLVKNIQFIIYQCDEFDSKEPELLKALIEVKQNLFKYIVEDLTEYKELAWGGNVQ